jgi:uncharacterized membrane protein
MTSSRIAAVSLALACMAAPDAAGAGQQPAQDQNLRVYYCNNLAIVTVRAFPDRVEVTTPARSASLPLTERSEAKGESKGQYTNGTVTLSGLEDRIRLEEPGITYWCQSLPAEVPWQGARFRGIDFRAAGSNPEWTLEVDSGVSVEFATGQGASRVVTKFPSAALTSSEKGNVLAAKSGTHSLTVVSQKGLCEHAGSTMTLSVSVTLDGKTYSGCGRNLEPPPSQP